MRIKYFSKSEFIPIVIIFILITSPFISAFASDNEAKQPIHTVGKRLVKGTWSAGSTFSAKSKDYSNLDFLFAGVDKYYQKAYTIRLEGAYFFKENISAGMGLYYGGSDNNLVINILDDLVNREMQSIYKKYGGLGFIKNHIPIANSDIFYITNQTELYYDYQSGNSQTYVGSSLERKNSIKNSFGIGIRPGILIFFTEGFAFDVNMGILGFSHTVQKNKYTYPPNNPPSADLVKEDSKNRSTDINLKFDLLKVGFGFSYYF